MTRSLDMTLQQSASRSLAVEGMQMRRCLGSGSSVAETKMLDDNGVDVFSGSMDVRVVGWAALQACEGQSSQGRSAAVMSELRPELDEGVSRFES